MIRIYLIIIAVAVIIGVVATALIVSMVKKTKAVESEPEPKGIESDEELQRYLKDLERAESPEDVDRAERRLERGTLFVPGGPVGPMDGGEKITTHQISADNIYASSISIDSNGFRVYDPIMQRDIVYIKTYDGEVVRRYEL